jgi:hypothetical protein
MSLDAVNGEAIDTLDIPTVQRYTAEFAAGVDSSRIIITSLLRGFTQYSGRLLRLDKDLNVQWISAERFDGDFGSVKRNANGKPALADFNQDGWPEVYIHNEIYNAQTGNRLVNGGQNGIGKNPISSSQSIAADFIPSSPGLELAAGFSIYEVEINDTDSELSNNTTRRDLAINGVLYDGMTSAADFNADGVTDVIVMAEASNGEPLIYCYTAASGSPSLLASAIPPRAAGTRSTIGYPVIGQVGHDLALTIIVAVPQRLHAYRYDGSTNLARIWTLETVEDLASVAGITLFDLNGDGSNEMIYRGSDSLEIYDTRSVPPSKIASIACSAGTAAEHPIVTALDSTGQARICVTCDLPGLGTRLVAFGSADPINHPWAPARGIWNQFNYHVTNVNDDGTIPQFMEMPTTFMGQASLLDSSGMYDVPAANLYPDISCVNYDIDAQEYVITFDVINRDDASAGVAAGLPVSFYDGNPEAGGSLLTTVTTPAAIDRDDAMLGLTATVPRPVAGPVYLVVNSAYAGGPLADSIFVEPECDYTDNITSATLPTYTTEAIELCDGKTYTLVDTIIADAGTYVRKIKKMGGGQSGAEACDSIIIELTVTAGSYISQTTTLTDCDSIVVAGTTYFESTTVSDTTTALTGCDTIDILELIVLQSTCSEVQMMACDTFVWSADGMTYTESGLYEYMTTNLVGCDSVIKLQLEIVESSAAEISLSDCDSVSYDGMTYLRDTVFSETGTNLVGCDSTTTITIDVTSSASPTLITADACDSVVVDGQLYYRDTTITRTLSGVEGCDSLVQLDITLRSSTMATVQEMACDTFVWSADGMTYRETGTYEVTITNAVGCDSLMILELEVSASTIGSTSISACDSVSYDGTTYLRDTVLSETGTNLVGCDSTTTITIDVISSASPTMVAVSACDSIELGGTTYYTDQAIEQTFASALGCDSLVVTEVSIQSSVQQSVTQSACDSLIYDGRLLRASGSYDFMYATVDGCDSLVTLDLTVGGSVTEEVATACDTFVWLVNAASYTETGTYEQGYIDAVGCDSIYLLELTIESIYEVTEVVTACDSYTWQRSGEILSTSGDYDYAVMSTDEACDSIYYLDLTISASYTDTLRVDTVDSYTWAVTGEEYSDGGLYVTSLTSIDGCDSILTLDLTLRNEQTVANYTWPNIINPTSAVNGTFTIYGDEAITTIQSLKVYDRWGSLVWRGADLRPSDPSIGWDGTAYGRPVAQGVYVWMAELELTTGEVIVEVGDVAVIR